MLEYFSPRVLLDAGIFYPRDTTGCWNISPKGHYWLHEYSTPGIPLDAGIFHPMGTAEYRNIPPQDTIGC